MGRGGWRVGKTDAVVLYGGEEAKREGIMRGRVEGVERRWSNGYWTRREEGGDRGWR